MDAVVQRITAVELIVGDLRTTLTAQAQSADNGRMAMEQLAAQISTVNASHDLLHREISELRSRGTGAGAKSRSGIGGKDLKLEVLGDAAGTGFRQQWPEWSDKAKDYLALRLPDEMDIRHLLTQLQSQSEPVSADDIEKAGLSTASIAELRFFLKNYTTGYPYDSISGLSDKSPLEMWRVLAQACDPMSHAGNFTDSQHLHSPKQAKSYENVPVQVAHWKRSLERWQARTGERLAESTQREALMRICPAELEWEIRKESHRLDTVVKSRSAYPTDGQSPYRAKEENRPSPSHVS